MAEHRVRGNEMNRSPELCKRAPLEMCVLLEPSRGALEFGGGPDRLRREVERDQVAHARAVLPVGNKRHGDGRTDQPRGRRLFLEAARGKGGPIRRERVECAVTPWSIDSSLRGQSEPFKCCARRNDSISCV